MKNIYWNILFSVLDVHLYKVSFDGMCLAGIIVIGIGFCIVLLPENWPDYITRLIRFAYHNIHSTEQEQSSNKRTQQILDKYNVYQYYLPNKCLPRTDQHTKKYQVCMFKKISSQKITTKNNTRKKISSSIIIFQHKQLYFKISCQLPGKKFFFQLSPLHTETLQCGYKKGIHINSYQSTSRYLTFQRCTACLASIAIQETVGIKAN